MNENLSVLVSEFETKLQDNERLLNDLNGELDSIEKTRRIKALQEENILIRNCIAALKTDIIYNTDFHELLLREYKIITLSNKIQLLKEERRKIGLLSRRNINEEIKNAEAELKRITKLR